MIRWLKEWDVITIPSLDVLGESPAVLISFKTGVNTGKGLRIVGIGLFEYKKQNLHEIASYASFRSISYLQRYLPYNFYEFCNKKILYRNTFLSTKYEYFPKEFKKIGFYEKVGEQMILRQLT